MKTKNSPWVFLLLFVNGFACTELKEKLLPAFTYTLPVVKLGVPAIPFVTGTSVPLGAMRTQINLDSTIKANTANTFSQASVTSIKVSKVRVSVTNADGVNNLSNFKQARIALYSDSTSIDMVTFNFPAEASQSFELIPAKKPELKGYLTGNQLAYNLFWENRRPTTKFLKLEVHITLSIK